MAALTHRLRITISLSIDLRMPRFVGSELAVMIKKASPNIHIILSQRSEIERHEFQNLITQGVIVDVLNNRSHLDDIRNHRKILHRNL
jgi:hypothetical protein